MPDRDSPGMLDRLDTLLARYLRRKRPRRLRGHFLGNDPARLPGERHLLGAPQHEIAAHPVLPSGLNRPINDSLPALHLQGNPGLPAAPGPLQGRAACTDRYLRHRSFQLSHFEARPERTTIRRAHRSRTTGTVAIEDFPRWGGDGDGRAEQLRGQGSPPTGPAARPHGPACSIEAVSPGNGAAALKQRRRAAGAVHCATMDVRIELLPSPNSPASPVRPSTAS